MAASRLHRLGTIFSRTTALLRCGGMKREDKPIWYDVYHVFPPKTEPSYGTKRYKPEIQEIFYPEDTIRAKFHKKIEKMLPLENLLQETTPDLTRRAIYLVYEMQRTQSLGEDEAIDKVIEILKKEGSIRASERKRPRKLQEEIVQVDTAKRKADTYEGDDISGEEKGRSLANDFREAVKDISDKNINVSKFFEKEKK